MPLFRPCRPCRLGRLRRRPGAPGLRCTHDGRPDPADAARGHARRARGRRRGRHRARPARRPHVALPDARGKARVRERLRRGRGRADTRRARHRGAARFDGDPAAGDGRRLMPSIEELYGEIWAGEEALDAELDRSLEPRGTDWLFTVFAELGSEPGQLVVDVGARDARHTIRLVREHGLRAVALDPVPLHVELATRAVADAGLDDEIDVVGAAVEAMPLPDGSADWIWCRDVLVHTRLAEALSECARVLRPGGRMLAYVTLATELLEPREAARLFEAVGVRAGRADPAALEASAADA